jgi:hypothetical protein
MQLLFTKPTQILPVLCLVSAEQQTGKTTFADFIARWLKGNVAIIGTADIEGNFNQHYALKHVIVIDESDLHKDRTSSKIKQMATQKREFRRGKFQNEYEVDYFAKLVIISNNEERFLNIKDEDMRYWIRNIPTIKSFDPDFLDKIDAELPAFTEFLLRRELQTKEAQSRMWFADSQYITKWLDKAKRANKSELYHDMYEKFTEWFAINEDKEYLIVRPSDVQNKWYSNLKTKYSVKYISTVLKDEFKVNPVREINETNIGNIGETKRFQASWYKIPKSIIND